jgi:hypothetical protein
MSPTLKRDYVFYDDKPRRLRHASLRYKIRLQTTSTLNSPALDSHDHPLQPSTGRRRI